MLCTKAGARQSAHPTRPWLPRAASQQRCSQVLDDLTVQLRDGADGH